MTRQLQKELYAKYPVLFQDTSKTKQESCMFWGIDFGDGWFNIFDQLCEYLTKLGSQTFHLKLKQPNESGEKYLKVQPPAVKFDQVKEKFGTMCIYWSHLPLKDYNLIAAQLEDPSRLDSMIRSNAGRTTAAIDFTAFLSSKTCELTGKPGRLLTEGWWKVRCEEEVPKAELT